MVLAGIAVFAVPMYIRIYLFAIDATRVVQMALELQPEGLYLPFLLQPDGTGNTLVVLQGVGRIGFGVQIIHTKIEYSLLPLSVGLTRLHFKSLAEEKQLAEPVGFESCPPWGRFARSLDLHHARGDIAVFSSGYASDDLHFLDVIGRDRAHVHTGSYAVPLRVGSVGIGLHVLHVRIGVDRSAVNDERGT